MNSKHDFDRSRTIPAARVPGAVLFIATLLTAWTVAPPAFAAGVFYVETGNPSCSDSGPGTEAVPYCRILKAAQAKGGPGTTLLVKPGTYREQVTVSASGLPGSPFVIQATGPGVIVDGADDMAQPGLWVQVSGNVWKAPDVDWNTRQVFLEGMRLIPSTASPTSLPGGAFRWIQGEGLYVNIGVGNPGLRSIQAGRRNNGFRLNGVSWVSIDGFTVTHAEDIGIYMLGGCGGNTVIRNTVNQARNNGIAASDCTNLLVASNVVSDNTDHGIYFWNGANDSVIRDNESFDNERLGSLGANGIKIESTERNILESNRTHDNQDSGIQINLSLDSLSRYNLSHHNGDHGFDQLGSQRTLLIGDVASGNHRDGFSIEGGNQDIHIGNAIAVDNGLTTGNHDLYVDDTSTLGFDSNFNIFWNSDGHPAVSFDGISYATLQAFNAATGFDGNSLETDPMFVDASTGDFRFLPGSPAIDSADSSMPHFTTTDSMGHPRIDDPLSPNAGAGPYPYADRGAFEFDQDCFGGAGSSCGTMELGQCALGVSQCTDGVLTCVGQVLPSAEICDGIDNDCDGAVDNAPTGTIRIEVSGDDTATITWDPLVEATGYDVVAGDLGDLAVTGGDYELATRDCVAAGTSETTVQAGGSPSPGTGTWYLVRAVSCGGSGSFDEAGPWQVVRRDAGIDASPYGCP